jgi:hypothetical protein
MALNDIQQNESDLVRSPIEIAARLYRDQTDAVLKTLSPKPTVRTNNALVELRRLGVFAKDVR